MPLKGVQGFSVQMETAIKPQTATGAQKLPGGNGRPAPGERLFNKNYFLLWQGQFISRLGNQAYYIAMILWIKNGFEADIAKTLIGVMSMFAGIPAVLLSAIGGAVADRYSRKMIIVASDVLNAISALLLAVLFFITPGKMNVLLAGVIIVNTISASLSSFFGPAMSAAIPDIVPKSKVTAANSMGQLTVQLAQFFGMGFGAYLLILLGAPLLVIVNGFAFLFAGFTKMYIKIPQVIPEAKSKISETLRAIRADIREGVDYIMLNSGLRTLLFVSIFITFFSTPITILLPFFISDVLHAPDTWFGPLLIAFGIGTLIGYLSVGFIKMKGKTRARYMIMFMVLNATGYIVLGFVRQPLPALGLFFLGGVFSGFIIVNITTLLQLTTPQHIRGRVFGALTTISGSIAPVAAGLTGPLASLLGDDQLHLIYIGSGIILVFLCILISMRRDFRKMISYKTKDEKEDFNGFYYNIRVLEDEETPSQFDVNDILNKQILWRNQL
jgi:MFS family permease